MNILVLGSEGQIGKPLSRMLKENGHIVTEIDILIDETHDLRVAGCIDSILQNIDFVFFLAFDVGGSIYLNNKQSSFDFISNNVKILDSVFDSIRKNNVPFIFTSSQMAEMGYSSYGVLKRTGEFYTKSLGGMYVRLWNVYGLEHNNERTHVITDFISMAKTAGVINMATDGNEMRQFLYVEDCCKCLCLLINYYVAIDKSNPICISSFKWHSIYEVASVVASAFSNCQIIRGSKNDEVQQNYMNEPDDSILELWEPETSIINGINMIIKQYD